MSDKRPPTPEMLAARDELVKEYGAPIVDMAAFLGKWNSGLTAIIACPTKEVVDRIAVDLKVSIAQFFGEAMPSYGVKTEGLVECAKRIDSIVDLAMMDDAELRGLPGFDVSKYKH